MKLKEYKEKKMQEPEFASAYAEIMEKKMAWRDDPITEKQKSLIADMMEFSAYPLLKFTGSTKGEASDYIDKYGKLAYEDVNSPMFGY